MILFLILSVFANAEVWWVDQNGLALYKTIEVCQKYSSPTPCFKTDEGFAKQYYELKNGQFLKNPQLEQNFKAAFKAKEDAASAEKSEIARVLNKLKTQPLTAEEISTVLKFLLKDFNKK